MTMKRNIILLALAVSMQAAISCDGGMPLVSRSKLAQVEAEKQELLSSLDSVQASFAKQNQDLNYILSELAAISSRTARLRIEGEEAPVTQMELALDDLNALKGKIDRLERDSENARRLNKDLAVSAKTIKELRETVGNQEKEIIRLKKSLAESLETIRNQSSTIKTQNDTISVQTKRLLTQKEELARTVARQTEMLFLAGKEIGRIAGEGDFKITGKRNKENVREYRKSIYRQALEFYQAAADEGHQAARDSIVATSLAIKQL